MKSYTAWIGAAGCFIMAFSQWLIFSYAPEEAVMGTVQKIFYLHLPPAWWGLISFGVSCVFSILFLKKRQWKHDKISEAATEIGMICCTITLITGSIWGKHSWGVWWTWDPRLTTALILWFIYAGCIVLRKMPMEEKQRATLCSVVSIAGFLDVPLVFLSAHFWRSIHPAVFTSKGVGMEREMMITLLFCIIGFGLVWFSLLLLRSSQLLTKMKLDALRTQRFFNESE